MKILKNIPDKLYTPYNRYGKNIKGLYWFNINYDKYSGIGTFILKFEPNSITNYHRHKNYEDFYILNGELIDSKGNIFRENTLVSMEPNSIHYTYSIKGCKVLVFSQGKNIVLSKL